MSKAGVSMVEELNSLKARVPELEKALLSAQESADKAKQALTVNTEEVQRLGKEMEQVKSSSAEAIAKAATELKAAQELAVTWQAKAEAAEAKLKLEPFADVTDGRKPVVDGGAEAASAPAEKTGPQHVEHMLTLHGAERVKYYREHKAIIDAQYASQK